MRLQASRQASPGDHRACRNLSAEVWNGYRELVNCFARTWFRQRRQQMSQTKQTRFLLLTTDRSCRNLNVISLSVGCSCTSSWVAWWSWCCLGCTRSWRPERCVVFCFLPRVFKIPGVWQLESFNPARAEEENPSEGGEGHRRDERRRHQLDPSGDSQCHEYVRTVSQQSLRWEWSAARIWYWHFCLTDKASPKASPRKRANRAAGADQWERFLPSLYLKGNQHFRSLVFKLIGVLKVFVLIQPAEASICSD